MTTSWKFEATTTKDKNFDNFDQLWESLGPPNGPLHQKLLHKWFHIANMNTFWKFEASTTKDKNFEILAIFGPP